MLPNFYQTELLEAGCDEAGRGCLAGPVFAAAVILPPDFHHPLLNDSKQMTEKNRNLLREIICSEAIAWAVEAVSAERIDKINILNASFEGMTLAASKLDPKPQFFSYRWQPLPHNTRYTLPMYRQRRWQICGHSGSVGIGKDLPR